MNNIFKINGNTEQFPEFDEFYKLSSKFLPYAQEKLGFNKPVSINLLSDPDNAKNPLGKTAYYDPGKMSITIYVDKRHLKDILRSMAHELVHHTQNCRGEFDGGIQTGPGYAQEDDHMRKMEAEAYLEGSGFLLRDWEDTLKKENQTMSTVSEQKTEKYNDSPALKGDQDELPDALQKGIIDASGDEETEEIEEGKDKKCPKCDKMICEPHCVENRDDEKEEVNENWFKGNKDKLLFETLMKKWTK
jgi:hypothetical protein